MMKKIIIAVLICAMLMAGSATVLAEEANDTAVDTQGNGGGKTIEELFDIYNPTGKSTYLDLQVEHQAFHDDRQSIRLEVIQYYAAQVSVVSGQIADGTLTPEDGRAQLDAIRSEVTTMRGDIEAIGDQKQIEADAIKARFTALREQIKEALKSDEVVASEVAAYLEQFNDLLADHIEMDYKYAQMVDALLPAY